MRSLSAIALLIVCALLASLPQAAAQQQPAQQQPAIARITPEALATAMTQAGWKSQVAVENNEKYIKLSIYQNRLNAFIDLYDCNPQGCSFVTFVIVFAKDPKQTPVLSNTFNLQTRFVRGAALDDGRFVIFSDVDLTGGVTLRHLQEAGGNFEGAVGEFLKLMN
jgi:Putative bacterial sensory transduction regulator